MELFSELNRKTIIFDIDGTLADTTHRLYHLEKTPKDWPGFYEGIEDDPLIEEIYNIYKMYSLQPNRYHIILCTGRDELYRGQTEVWLAKHRIEVEGLFMRPTLPDDAIHPEDHQVKSDILDGLLSKGHTIEVVYEDRDQVVSMWRRRGIRCLQVAEGAF